MILAVPLAALLFGYGGKSLPAQDPDDLGVFVGTWTGTWKGADEMARGGTLRVTLARSSDGKSLTMSGTVYDPAKGEGTIAGGIYAERKASFGFQFQGTSMFFGTASIDSRGHLVGPFKWDVGDFQVPTAFDLAPMRR